MAPRHARKGSGRAPLPRRTTRGPLDEDDPLSSPASTLTSPLRSEVTSPLDTPPIMMENADPLQSFSTPAPDHEVELKLPETDEKDLSFLLDPSIYHPLSQVETATPFRRPLLQLPLRNTSLTASLSQLDSLLARCDYLSAAHLAAGILTSGMLKPTDIESVFHLISLRYSCLELTGNVLLAAQEAKALEDLTSAFYYVNLISRPDSETNSAQRSPPSHHIMPFALRLQALRLQSIGFSDPRRGVTALYEVGLECREHLSSPNKAPEDQKIWQARLEEVGLRVVNALVEMGEVDCASRTLESLRPKDSKERSRWMYQTALISIRLGDLAIAKEIIASLGTSETGGFSLTALLAIADGRYEDAAQLWESQNNVKTDTDHAALVKQNLAVACLYSGRYEKARTLLESLVEDGHSFSSLTINLATILELCSDRSRELKMAMAAKIAKQEENSGFVSSRSNADFRL